MTEPTMETLEGLETLGPMLDLLEKLDLETSDTP